MAGRGPKRARWAGVVAVTMSLAACGTDAEDSPEAASNSPTSAVAVSAQCDQAFRQGHNAEAAGQATNLAFLPSIEKCDSLGEWIAAAMAFGVDLQGQEATFVDDVCRTADEEILSSRICTQAEEQFRSG